MTRAAMVFGIVAVSLTLVWMFRAGFFMHGD
jgi:hypothetical protein